MELVKWKIDKLKEKEERLNDMLWPNDEMMEEQKEEVELLKKEFEDIEHDYQSKIQKLE